MCAKIINVGDMYLVPDAFKMVGTTRDGKWIRYHCQCGGCWCSECQEMLPIITGCPNCGRPMSGTVGTTICQCGSELCSCWAANDRSAVILTGFSLPNIAADDDII